MKVRYIYSACVVIETPDVTILCDPWFTPGAYDGSWYQYPVLDDPVAAIGGVDFIYVSHIHPDHYDAGFLRRYLSRYPLARILIAAQQPSFLAAKMRMDGFRPEEIERLSAGETDLLIVPNEGADGRKSDIDTALAVRYGDLSAVNLNDNPFEPDQVAALLAFCPGGRPTFALLPYSGAGPYPQTFSFPDDAAQRAAADRKKEQFLNLFGQYLDALRPRHALPFAGKYYLGGPLAGLNDRRGVPDATEVAARYGDRVLVLADGGAATYDLATGEASARRTAPYDHHAIEAHLSALPIAGFDYELEIRPATGRRLPLFPLLVTAKRRARSRVTIEQPYWIVLRPTGDPNCLIFNIADDAMPLLRPSDASAADLEPRLEITIDGRYLFGLLTRLYHWNNAEVGSQYRSLRVPDLYRPEVYGFLISLQV